LDGQQRTDLAHRAFTFTLAGSGFVADLVVVTLRKRQCFGAVVADQFNGIVLARVLVAVDRVVIVRHKDTSVSVGFSTTDAANSGSGDIAIRIPAGRPTRPRTGTGRCNIRCALRHLVCRSPT